MIPLAILFLALAASPPSDLDRGISAYENGDYDTAASVLLPLAEEGSPVAQRVIGHMYASGHGLGESPRTAVRWYRKAADQGDLEALNALAMMHYAGKGVAVDWVEAARLFQIAAEQGLPEAQYNLGVIYDDGHGVPQDTVAAAQWIRSAAEQGYAEAQFYMGLHYCCLDEDNEVLRYMWLSLAANQGHDRAKSARESHAGNMTEEELAEGRRLVAARRPKKGLP
jgi:TPR repeat protein